MRNQKWRIQKTKWNQWRNKKTEDLKDESETKEPEEEPEAKKKTSPVDQLMNDVERYKNRVMWSRDTHFLRLSCHWILNDRTTHEETVFQFFMVSKRWRSFFFVPCVLPYTNVLDGGGNVFAATLPSFIMMEKVTPYLTNMDSRGLMPEKVKKKYRSILENANLD
ncbi:hypothetical protein BDA99DRAFT_567093 [Phascolomyces articulosus]|uniref:Uncharacterized protein n=1 Tax=Phascolomyces articulosus TaxID=60185 RepID=A0AAD5KYD1_9FUNG|nr:hypothetical protein BDA99DRAFT_567093 [Phascolomyces articulosus]